MSNQWGFFPTIEAIIEVDDSIVDRLPVDYAGTVDNRSLAEAFVFAFERKPFTDINVVAHPDFVAPFVSQPQGTIYAQLAHMYAMDREDAVIFWDFLSLNKNKTLSVSMFYYIVGLLSKFTGARLTNVFMMVSAIHAHQLADRYELENIQLPTIATINNIDVISAMLRAEGAPVEARKLWLASLSFPPSEVMRLLEEGLPIERAVQMYELGYTTVDEIKENINAIPESWIESLFGDFSTEDSDGDDLFYL